MSLINFKVWFDPEQSDYVVVPVQGDPSAHAITAAIQAYGVAVLVPAQDDPVDAAAKAGRRLLQQIFGTRQAGEPLPNHLAQLVANPLGWKAMRGLGRTIDAQLEADPQLKAEVEREILSWVREGLLPFPPPDDRVPQILAEGMRTSDDHDLHAAPSSSPDGDDHDLDEAPSSSHCYYDDAGVAPDEIYRGLGSDRVGD